LLDALIGGRDKPGAGFARNPNTAVSFGIGRIGRIGMDHDGPPIIPIRPILSDPPNTEATPEASQDG
jgi:hypothetical protein